MAAFLNLFKKFRPKEEESKKKKIHSCIKKDCNPNEFWENICELGDGAFGKVYKAEQKNTQQIAAVKQIILDGEEDLDDSMVEIEILNDSKHQNIIQLFEVYLYNSVLYMYIEFCGAGAIDSIMLELDKPLTESQIRFVCHYVSQALSYLHAHHIVHRDMKAGNVLLTVQGEVKLADFGVSAKNQSEKQKRDSFIGTPYWMAPEVMACETFKDNPYDCRADVWSLGITLIEFAQMHPPNHEMNAMRVLIKIQKGEAPELDNSHGWSKEFNSFVKKCLVKNPSERAFMNDLLQHPFIKEVSENDRKAVYALICEFKADVIEDIEEGSVRDSMYSILDNADSEADTASISTPKPYLSVDKNMKTADIGSDNVSVEESSREPVDLDSTVSDNRPADKEETIHQNEADDAQVSGMSSETTLQQDNHQSPELTNQDNSSRVKESNEDDLSDSARESRAIDEFVNDIINKAIKSLSESSTGQTESKPIGEENESSILDQTLTDCSNLTGDDSVAESNESKADIDIRTNDQKSHKETDVDIQAAPSANDSVISSSSNKDNLKALRRQSYRMAAGDDEKEELENEPASATTVEKAIPDTIMEDESEDGNQRPIMRPERRKSCYRTINRTRKFIVDGKEITTTTTRVVRNDENILSDEERRLQQRQDFREMKIIAKEEKRQDRDFTVRCDQAKEQFQQKFKAEEVVLQRNCDTDLDNLEKEKKTLIDRAEDHKETDIRHMLRRMKTENGKTERRFREKHETEQNLLKAEVEIYPKDQRKEKFRQRKEIIDMEFAEKLNSLREENKKKLQEEEERMKREHRIQIKEIELDILKKKQEKIKVYEEKRWQMFRNHCQQRFQQEKHQLKDYFNLKRNQTARRLEREAQQLNNVIAREVAQLQQAHQQERRQMPKRLKVLYKTRLIMKKESLRIKDSSNLSIEEENKILKAFEESERERMRLESESLEKRLKRAIDDLGKQHDQRRKDLSQLQMEKKKSLTDIETARTSELEEKFKLETARLKELMMSKIQELERQQIKERTDLETYFLNEECVNSMNLMSTPDRFSDTLSHKLRSDSSASKDDSALSNMSISSTSSQNNGNSFFYFSQLTEVTSPNVTLNESSEDKLI